MDRRQLCGHPHQRRRRPVGQPARFRRCELHRGRRLRLVADGGLSGRAGIGDGPVGHGARRWRRHSAGAVWIPVLLENPGAVPARTLLVVRGRGRWSRDLRRARHGGAEAARRCGARRRQDLCRDQGRGRLVGRQGPLDDRAASRWPDPRAEPRLRDGRLQPLDRGPFRGAWHRHRGGRHGGNDDRDAPDAGGGGRAQTIRHRFDQDPDRPHQGLCGHRGADQGHAGAASRGAAAPWPRRSGERQARRRGHAALRGRPAPALAAAFGRAAPRRCVGLRLWRHEFPRHA